MKLRLHRVHRVPADSLRLRTVGGWLTDGLVDPVSNSPREIPTRLNAVIVICQLMALGGCFYSLSVTESGWALAGLSVVFGVVMNSVYSVIHEAEHGILFPDRKWNDAAGMAMALFFPAPFHLIRQGHLGHHLRNRSDDEAFDLYFDDDHRVWRCLIFYGILTGFYWVIVVLGNVVFLLLPFSIDKKYWEFDRPSAAFMESLNPRYRRVIQLECVAVLALHAGIILLLRISWWQYAVMYAGFGFMWSAMQYVHHYGTVRHVTKGARNLRIWEPLDRLWLNHNWHLAHHEHPTVPWLHLPEQAAADGDARRGFLPWAYLKMWRGPRKTSEHVRNQHAGRIIR